MVKKLSVIILLCGVTLTVIALVQFFQTNQLQKKSLAAITETITAAKNSQKSVKNTGAGFHPKSGDTIGILIIPKLNAKLPIVEGTDESQLKKGVGHYKSSALPNGRNQIVLSGHRDTVFRRIGKLQHGDTLVIKLSYGTFLYKIFHFKIVKANDRTVIHSTAPQEILTLTTCYPFSYIGNAPERYIISARRTAS